MARVQIFLSTVSAEFQSYRDRLRHDLTRPNVSVAVQEDFIVTGTETLDMLDDYIRQCDAVIHLVGDMTGALAQTPSLNLIRNRYPDMVWKLPQLAPFLQHDAPALPYTQWEAWLALYHGKPLIIAAPADNAPRDERYVRVPEQYLAQQTHLQRLGQMERYPFRFTDSKGLAVEILRSKLFEILARADPPTRPVPSDPKLLTLLTTVKRDWIEGVRANSLHEIVKLELGKESYAHAIDHPLKEVIELGDQRVEQFPVNTSVFEIFRRAGEFLLILGEPGAGKTITMLDLAKDLIEAAEVDAINPIPVVLNLSTWKETNDDLNHWIIGELKSKYFVHERLGKKWLNESKLLLMLDGLDEVQFNARAHCVKAINAFLEEFSPRGMVVTCRFREYEDLPIQLRFRGAIKLLPLTTDQIDQYLASVGLEDIRTAVNGDSSLRTMARSPLVLNIIVLAYKGDVSSDLLLEDVTGNERYKNLLNRYIQKMFKRKGESNQLYERGKVMRTISWLAHHLVERSQTVFLIESLQPDWLSGQRAWWAYWVGSRAIWATIYGLVLVVVWMAWSQITHDTVRGLVPTSISIYAVLGIVFSFCTFGCVNGLIDGQIYRGRNTAQTRSSMRQFIIRTLIYSGSYLLLLAPIILLAPKRMAELAMGASGTLLIYIAPIASFRSAKRDTYGDIITKAFGWSWKRAERGYMWGIFCTMVLLGFELPVIAMLATDVPAVVGIIGLCTTFIMLAWPYLQYRTRLEVIGQISFLSKMGMVNYLNATIRLILLMLMMGLMMVFVMPAGKWSSMDIQGIKKIGIAVAAIVSVPIYIGIVAGSFSGIKPNTIESTTVPNQGIILTFRHAMISSMLVFMLGTLLVCGPVFVLEALKKSNDINLAFAYFVGSVFWALTVGLWYSTAVLRHFLLRFILSRQGYIPQNLAGLLDYATSLIFLQKVGGGYVFIHRLVMEHFANLKQTPENLPSTIETPRN